MGEACGQTWHMSAHTVGQANHRALLVPVSDSTDAVQGSLHTHPVILMEGVCVTVT